MVCSGKSYYDTIGAGATGHPILLVGDSLTKAQRNYLKGRSGSRYTLVGGPAAVSNNLQNALSKYGVTNRFWGKNCYETAYMVAKKFFGTKSKEVVLVNAGNFYDGIMAAPLAQQKKCPILMNSGTDIATAYNYEVKYGVRETTIIGTAPTVPTAGAASSGRMKQGWNSYSGKSVYISSSGYIQNSTFKYNGYTVTPSKGGFIPAGVEADIRRFADSASYGTAIVIHINDQKLDYAKNGEVVFTTDVVTGDKGYHDTPVGYYYVRGKYRDVNLVGATWNSFVYYWMPFKGNYYGIHDATWRSNFGGNIYNGNGSHGCVNLPYSKMVTLWGMIDVGTSVIVKK